MMLPLRDALSDPDLLGAYFSPWDDWRGWAVVCSAILGEPLDPKERVLFKKLFGYDYTAGHPVAESLVLAGRGSGKTKVSAALVTCIAALRDWTHLKRRARALLIAVDKEQASEAFSFVEQYFTSPALAPMVVGKTKLSITLKNNIVIQIRTASARGLRGPSVVAAIVDEASYLPKEPSVNSDLKIYRALRPALSKVPNSLLISISSTGERTGVAYDLYEKYFGVKDAPVLVCLAKSIDLNGTKDHAKARAAAFALDPYSAAAEYDSLFFEDEAAFISRDRVSIVTDANPPLPTRGRVFCGLDPSGGALKGDSFAMACSWVADGRIKLGFVEARAGRRDPVETCTEFATMLKPYAPRLTIISDAYGGAFVPALFRRHGLTIYPPHKRNVLDGSGRMNQSDYFLGLLGRLKVVDWPNHPALLKELFALVRNPDGVSHTSTGHDDIVGAAARAIHSAAMWLDQHAPVEEAPEPEPDETDEEYGTVMGHHDPDWHKRAVGTVMSSDSWRPSPPRPSNGKPNPDSMAARLEHAALNESYRYLGEGRWA